MKRPGRGSDSDRPLVKRRISRRSFLKGTGTALLGTTGAMVVSCGAEDPEPFQLPDQTELYALVVPPPPIIQPDVLRFFTVHEAATVDAITSRLLPGDEDDPGASEMGILVFIDTMLSYNQGIWEPAYRESPWVETYTGEPQPPVDAGHWLPEPGVDPREPTFFDLDPGVQAVQVQEDELSRYGPQLPMTPGDTYRIGLVALDILANQEYESDFIELDEEEQDSLLAMVEDGDADVFTQPSGEDFFTRLKDDTIAGAFSDPAYGGNRDKAGWRLIDYPGAQRAYTPNDMHTESNDREPKSLEDLRAFNPGQHTNGIVPVRGSRENRGEDPVNEGTLRWE